MSFFPFWKLLFLPPPPPTTPQLLQPSSWETVALAKGKGIQFANSIIICKLMTVSTYKTNIKVSETQAMGDEYIHRVNKSTFWQRHLKCLFLLQGCSLFLDSNNFILLPMKLAGTKTQLNPTPQPDFSKLEPNFWVKATITPASPLNYPSTSQSLESASESPKKPRILVFL